MSSNISFARTSILVAGSFGLLAMPQAFSEPHSDLHTAGGRLIASAQHSKKTLKIKIDREVVMADDLMLKGKYGDAAELYRQVAGKAPKNVPATVGYGMALAKQFKLDAASEQFDKAL